MYIKPITLVFDPTGTNPENFVQAEKHTFIEGRDRYFAPRQGSFYTHTLIVRDMETGVLLEPKKDYTALHLYLEPTSHTGLEVCAMIHVSNEVYNEVEITYQATGGKYQDLTEVIFMLMEQFPDGGVGNVVWKNISGLPVEFAPVAHMHRINDFSEWNLLIKSLYGVYNSLAAKRIIQYKDIFKTLNTSVAAFETRLDRQLNTLDSNMTRIIERSYIPEGEYLLTDNKTVPSNYLGYGAWTLAGKGMHFGIGADSTAGETFAVDVASTSDVIAARKAYFWMRDPTGIPYGISLVRSVSEAGEGDTVTITLVTQGMSTAKTFNYEIRGIQANDIDQPLTGSLLTGNNGKATFTFTVLADNLTEGVETLRFVIKDWATFTTVRLRDTSTAAQIDLGIYYNNTGAGSSITMCNEGETVNVIAKTQNIPADTKLYFHYIFKNGFESADFDIDLPQYMVVSSSGFALATLKIKKDYRSEGTETMGVSISYDGNPDNIIATKWVRVNDTSRSPTYVLRFSSDELGSTTIQTSGEGDTIYLIVETKNVPDGTEFGLVYSGTTDDADFVGTRPLRITLNENFKAIPFKVKDDVLSEGTETFGVVLTSNGSAVSNAQVEIFDTSVGVGGNIGFSTIAASYPTSALTHVNEGSTLYLIFNVPASQNGMVYNLVYEGTVNAADFSNVRATTVTIVNGRAVVRYDIREDAANEGEELFRVRVYEQGNTKLVASTQVFIRDTSTSPTYDITYTDGEFSDTILDEVDEGKLLYVLIHTNNVVDGDYLYLDWYVGNRPATTANSDVVTNPLRSVQVFNGRAMAVVNLARDESTEGDEYLRLDIRTSVESGAPVVGSKSILIRDTSKTPEYNIKFTSMLNGGSVLNGQTLLEGLTVYAQVETKNVADGTVLWINYDSSSIAVASQEDFSTPLPSQVIINNNKATITYQSITDWNRDNGTVLQEEFRVNLYTNAQMTIKVTDAYVRFIDPTISLRPSANAQGTGTLNIVNEGESFYLIVETTDVIDGSTLPVTATIGDVTMAVDNGYLTEAIPTQVVINANFAAIPVKLKKPMPISADSIMNFRIKHPGDGTAVNLATTNLKVAKL